MEKYTWLPEVLKELGMLCIGIGLIMLAVQRNKKRIDAEVQNRKQHRHPLAKNLDELPTGETISIIDFNDANKPIAELIHEFAFQLPKEQRKFFVLQDAETFDLEKGKTYKVERIGSSEIVNLKQVAIMF